MSGGAAAPADSTEKKIGGSVDTAADPKCYKCYAKGYRSKNNAVRCERQSKS
jgi:hypothetical protein